MNTFLINGTTLKIFSTFNDEHNNNFKFETSNLLTSIPKLHRYHHFNNICYFKKKVFLSRKMHWWIIILSFYFSSLFLLAGATVFVHGRGARPTVSQCLISDSENVGVFVTDGAQVNKKDIVSNSWGIANRDNLINGNTIACNTLKPPLRADCQERGYWTLKRGWLLKQGFPKPMWYVKVELVYMVYIYCIV